MRFDSVSEVLGGTKTLIVRLPSLKGGRNSRPKNGTVAMAASTTRTNVPSTRLERGNPNARTRPTSAFTPRTSAESRACFIRFIFGRR